MRIQRIRLEHHRNISVFWLNIIHNALIRHVNVPDQILSPIQEASIAIEQDLTNKEKQNTARKQAELNTELGLIEQRREQVAQETEKLRAEIKADQERQVEGAVIVSIVDTGIGIPKSALGKIGNPFEQVQSQYAKSKGGSGLGLAISRSLAHLHGGAMRIHSIEGKGTIISVRIPDRERLAALHLAA